MLVEVRGVALLVRLAYSSLHVLAAGVVVLTNEEAENCWRARSRGHAGIDLSGSCLISSNISSGFPWMHQEAPLPISNFSAELAASSGAGGQEAELQGQQGQRIGAAAPREGEDNLFWARGLLVEVDSDAAAEGH
eukprot:CAMPEP_0194779886 /NCGR_PEP_ID=MMETSP0323_2-20130528/72243_1 /TAXON_ID=2866 ORGANISM="Crypthecodinium cohnii, Strain Seligo" /NCGR_SAMPLE_ID=MMETSP0323_2 /ASSEMBLY_ACC=CAM_ASM_000346 /LENGTH=134 /DNA_ID=CAMNT_0039717703 /DNA_START=34 /DNA_END=436 /DNA_ORIENTATION=+